MTERASADRRDRRLNLRRAWPKVSGFFEIVGVLLVVLAFLSPFVGMFLLHSYEMEQVVELQRHAAATCGSVQSFKITTWVCPEILLDGHPEHQRCIQMCRDIAFEEMRDPSRISRR
jgi:hypothetical protein